MKIKDALEHIIVSAILHVMNMQIKDEGAVSISTELLRFVDAQGFEQLEVEIPGITFVDVEEWARNYSYSLYIHKGIIPDGADRFSIVCQFKNTLPQVYDDLLFHGEVLEARLRTEVNH
jgi:hypothetical protein